MKKRNLQKLLLLPSLFGFCFFYIFPFIKVLKYAFFDNSFTEKFVGIDNFKQLLSSDYFMLAMKNTFIFTAIGVPTLIILSLILAFLIANMINKISFVQKSIFLPFLLPSATVVAFWQAFFSEVPPFSSLLLVYLWKYMGLVVMLLLSAISTLDTDMLEAAKIDGAGRLKTIISVCIPNITPTLLFSVILSFVNSLKIYRESYLLYGNYPDKNIYMLQNYLNNHFDKLNYQNISAAAIIVFALVYVVVGFALALEKKVSCHL